MKSINGKNSLLLLLIFLLPFSAYTQSTKQKKEQLQLQMKKLQDEIKSIESAIQSTSAKKKKSMSEILSLQAKIRSREKLIKNMNSQIDALDNVINQTESDIEDKSKQVAKMKADYASMLVKTYKNLTLRNELSFLLSSSSFYEGVQRYNYLLKIAEYRRVQTKALENAIGELEERKDVLEENKEHKLTLLQQQTAQKEKIEKEKKEKDVAVADLQEKERKLKRQATEKNQAAQKLNNKIQAIIEEEIREAKRKAEEEARRKPGSTKEVVINKKTNETMPLTPEEQALSKDFSNNMGKLPWPVSRGHIVGHFGKHEHPALKGVMIENNGVDIKTVTGSEARAVFGGTVVSVFSLPTTQSCVIIKHGEYFTVYANIDEVAVKTNQTITTKQSLGKLHTDKAEDLTKVHIEIWKGKDKMDPAVWLAGQ